MRILFIHTRYLQSYGGEDTTVEAETNLLRSRGHEVYVELFDNTDMGKGIKGKINAGIQSVYNLSSAKRIERRIRDIRPDIVHVHNFFFMASPSVLYAASRMGVPVVATIQNFRLVCANALLLRNNKVCELCLPHDFPWHGVKYKCYHNSAVQSTMVGAMGAIHKWTGGWRKKVDLYITPAAFIRSKLLDSSLKPDPGKIKVKRNFIDDPGYGDPAARQSFYLFIGRLSPEKGVSTLLDAWRQMPGEQIRIVGDGPEKQKLVGQYGHLPNVDFVGKKPREEVLALMKTCKALIFPSVWYEGLPLTIIEAFATGTPVIGSALGAMQEMIGDAFNGLLFEPGDSNGLNEKVNQLNQYISAKDFTLHENARKSYLERYHPDQCYQDILGIYAELIKTKSSVRE